MRIGIALEGLLTDMETEFSLWMQRNQGGASSYLDPKVVNDETFWATLRMQANTALTMTTDDEIYVLTIRPVKLFLVTRSWLRREGIVVPDENIIMRSGGRLKRYDCRLNDIDYFVDSDPEVLESFKFDRCIPVGVGEGFPEWMHSYPTLSDVRFEPDLRDWKLWK